jgi:CubicO group peptidase (beta-lactamase class C family)
MKVVIRSLIVGVLLATALSFARAGELVKCKPEEVGLSSAKLQGIESAIEEVLKKKQTAGVVTVVARNGKIAYLKPMGMMDIEAGKPMAEDTIFRIYSMSKPITTVAAMTLYDEGRFQLDDPVSKFLPEFKDVKVYEDKDATVDQKSPMTMRDLMRHTSGLTYGAFGNTAVDRMYQEKNVLDYNHDLAHMVTKLGTIPLEYQPGTRFNYSMSVDVLGRVVEVISGKPLDEFLSERVLKPLDMKDTSFYVSKEKLGRLASVYGPKDDGLGVVEAVGEFEKKPALLSGGGELVSTARDYLRFCQMALNGGELDGTRILRPETLAMMTKNQLPAEAVPISVMGTAMPGVGFGLGFSVRVAAADDSAGVVGEFGWGGAASTHFWISPKDKLIVIVLQQHMPFYDRLERAVKPIVYDAIER